MWSVEDGGWRRHFDLRKYAVSEPSFARLWLNIAQQPLPVPVLAVNYRHAVLAPDPSAAVTARNALSDVNALKLFELYIRGNLHEFITLDTKCSICNIIRSSHGLESIFVASWYVQLLVK